MFNFRIINTADGNQIVDRKHTTSYEELTPLQMVEYVELEARLYHMDRIERNARKAADKKKSTLQNGFCGWIDIRETEENTVITSNFFNIGRVVVTWSINDYMSKESKFAAEIVSALRRYAQKDWGNLDEEDKQTNEEALKYPDDLYLLGAYDTSKGKIWIITNNISEIPGDMATTICFPDER